MNIIDKIFGPHDQPKPEVESQRPTTNQATPYQATSASLTDEQAIARYRYMLKTAPPEAIEQAHQEAFAALKPEQRRIVLQQLNSAVPEWERPASGTLAEDPPALARMATRAEMRQPGILERLFGGAPGTGSAPSMGAAIGGSFLAGIAGSFLGSLIAQHFFNNTVAGRSFLEGGGLAPVSAPVDDQDVETPSEEYADQDLDDESDSEDYDDSGDSGSNGDDSAGDDFAMEV